jgi:hypothetical protein
MRALRWALTAAVAASLLAPLSCGGGSDNGGNTDAGSNGATQCSDGIDNDGDGYIDYPDDPGCFVKLQDSETVDCPDGPNCPECANGRDDDMNNATDYPNDPGCTMAADPTEYTSNPFACGNNLMVKPLPFDGKATGMLMTAVTSHLTSACGGGGSEDVYEVRVMEPKVLVATTDLSQTEVDTVLSLRGESCADASSELGCNDNSATSDTGSTLTVSLPAAGTYYLIVDAADISGGAYALQVNYYAGEGSTCGTTTDCGPGIVCRTPMGGSDKVCARHVCEDDVDEDGDGDNGYPTDPGCDSPTDDDEADGCPGAGSDCPQRGDGSDNDGDGKTDYPMDLACASASGATESFCALETDPIAPITTKTVTGTTSGKTNDHDPECTSSDNTAADVVYSLALPVPVQSLQIDTDNSVIDTTLMVKSVDCSTEIDCDDDGGTTSYASQINMTDVAPGIYAIVVDGYDTDVGAYTLNVHGTVAQGTDCTSSLFSGGANAVLSCPSGTTCQGTCQP